MIRSMKLHRNVGRIHNEIAEPGRDRREPLEADELARFDQLHYHGSAAFDRALAMLAPDADAEWLESGSGLGGPARCLSGHGGLAVTALELQRDPQRAGFRIEFVEGTTEEWAAFARARPADFRAARERHLRVQRKAIVDVLDDFYASVDRHFQSGKLGGIRIQARRQA